MIHTANEYVSKHHRYLLSGVTIGLKSLDGKTGSAEDSDKGDQGFSPFFIPLQPPYSIAVQRSSSNV